MKKGKKLFVDTDCLSCFLFTDKGSLIQRVFPDRKIIIPHAVDVELNKNRIHYHDNLKKRKIIDGYDLAKQNNYFDVLDDFESESHEFYMVMKLVGKGYEGGPSIGLGEAQVIAAAYGSDDAVIASNNLRDITEYVQKLKIKNYTASDILYKAYEMGLEDETTIESLWCDLVTNDYFMPCNSFAEFKMRKEK